MFIYKYIYPIRVAITTYLEKVDHVKYTYFSALYMLIAIYQIQIFYEKYFQNFCNF